MNNITQYDPLRAYYKGRAVEFSQEAEREKRALKNEILRELGYGPHPNAELRIYINPFNQIVLEVWDAQKKERIFSPHERDLSASVRRNAQRILQVLEESYFNRYQSISQFSLPRTPPTQNQHPFSPSSRPHSAMPSRTDSPLPDEEAPEDAPEPEVHLSSPPLSPSPAPLNSGDFNESDTESDIVDHPIRPSPRPSAFKPISPNNSNQSDQDAPSPAARPPSRSFSASPAPLNLSSHSEPSPSPDSSRDLQLSPPLSFRPSTPHNDENLASELDDLSAKLQTAEDELAALQEALDAANNRAESLKIFSRQLAECNISLKKENHRIQNLYKTHLTSLTQERDILVNKLGERLTREDGERLQAELAEKDGEIQHLKEQLQDLSEQLESAEDELAALQEAVDAADSRVENFDVYSQQVATLNQSLRAQISALQESLRELRELEKEHEVVVAANWDLDNANWDLRTQNQTLQGNLQALEQPLRSFATLAIQTDALSPRISVACDDEPPSVLASPIEEPSQLAALAESVKELAQGNDHLRQENSLLKEQLEQAQKAAAAQRHIELQAATLASSISPTLPNGFEWEAALKAHAQLVQRQTTLMRRHFELLVRSALLKNQIARNDVSQALMQALQEQNTALQKHVDSISKELAANQLLQSQLSSLVNTLKTELSTLKISSQQKIENAQQALESALKEKEETIELLRLKLEKLETENAVAFTSEEMEQFLIETADEAAQDDQPEEILAKILPEHLFNYINQVNTLAQELAVEESIIYGQYRILSFQNVVIQALLRKRGQERDAIAAQLEQREIEFSAQTQAYEKTLAEITAGREELQHEVDQAKDQFREETSLLSQKMSQLESDLESLSRSTEVLTKQLKQAEKIVAKIQSSRNSLGIAATTQTSIAATQPALTASTLSSQNIPATALIPSLGIAATTQTSIAATQPALTASDLISHRVVASTLNPEPEDLAQFILDSDEAQALDEILAQETFDVEAYILKLEEENRTLMAKLEVADETRQHIRRKAAKARTLLTQLRQSFSLQRDLTDQSNEEIASLRNQIKELQSKIQEEQLKKEEAFDDLRQEFRVEKMELATAISQLEARLAGFNQKIYEQRASSLDQDSADRAFSLDLAHIQYDQDRPYVHPLVSPRGNTEDLLPLVPPAASASLINESLADDDFDPEYLIQPNLNLFDSRPDAQIEELQQRIDDLQLHEKEWNQEKESYSEFLALAAKRAEDFSKEKAALESRIKTLSELADDLDTKLRQARSTTTSSRSFQTQTEDDFDLSIPPAAEPSKEFVSADQYKKLVEEHQKLDTHLTEVEQGYTKEIARLKEKYTALKRTSTHHAGISEDTSTEKATRIQELEETVLKLQEERDLLATERAESERILRDIMIRLKAPGQSKLSGRTRPAFFTTDDLGNSGF